MTQRILLYVIGATISGTLIKLLLNAVSLLSPRLFSKRGLLYAQMIPMLFFTGLGLAAPSSFPITLGTVSKIGTSAAQFASAYKTMTVAAKGFPLFPALLVIWATVSLGCLFHTFYRYMVYRRLLCNHSSIYTPTGHIPIRRCDLISTPICIGFLYPIIFIPIDIAAGDSLDFAIAHELTHIRHGHLWIKLLAVILSALHWFNPIARRLQRDIHILCEAACDESLASRMDTRERLLYCNTILKSLEHDTMQREYLCSGLTSAESNVKERMEHILNFKNPKRTVIAALAVICSALLCVGVYASTWAKTTPAPDTSNQLVAEMTFLDDDGNEHQGLVTIVNDKENSELPTLEELAKSQDVKFSLVKNGEIVDYSDYVVEPNGDGYIIKIDSKEVMRLSLGKTDAN